MKKGISGLIFLLGCASASADGSSALNFAMQAGNIAGAAQACGQDISEFTNRINQSFAILANTAAEVNQATQTYQSYMITAAQKQTENRQIPCTQVIQDYNSLPIMQPDYERNVLGKLRVSVNKPVTFLPPQNNPNQPNPDQNSFTQGGIPGSSNTSSLSGIPNTPSNATQGIPNTPIDTNTTLITPSTSATAVPTTPSQFSTLPTATSNTPPSTTSAGADMAYSPPSTPQTTTSTPSNSSVLAIPQLNPASQ